MQHPVDLEVGDHNVVQLRASQECLCEDLKSWENERTGEGKEGATMAEMEERLEARLLERVMQKVQEQLPPQEPSRSSSELPKKGQS